MNKGYSTRGRTWVAGFAAAAVTTVLVSSLVESFDPAQLLKFQGETASAPIAAVDDRNEALRREA